MTNQSRSFIDMFNRGHSTVILTADRKDASPGTNLRNRVALFKQLQQFVAGGWAHTLHDVVGFYEGEEEHGFALVLHELYVGSTVHWLLSIAAGYRQDCILKFNSGHAAYLINSQTGDAGYAGIIHQFDPVAEGDQPTAYSIIEGRYFRVSR